LAVFDEAVQITLGQEGGFFQNAKTGEVVNWGITQKFLAAHNLPSSVDDVRNLTKPAAINLYRIYFWTPMRMSEIKDQALAAKVFDVGVNQGPSTSAALFQGAINDEWGREWIRTDGIIGEATIGCANASDPVKLITAFRARAKDHYIELAEKNPKLKDDLAGWLARLASN
jgi:lysozyme family protein